MPQCVWVCSIDRAVRWFTACVKEYEWVSKCESVAKWVKWVILFVWEWLIQFVSHYPALCVCVTCQKCVSFEAAECWRALSVLSVAGDWGGPGACPLPPVTGSVCGSVLHHSATSLAGCATPTHMNTQILNNAICQLRQSDTSRFSWTQFDDTIFILICHRNDTKNSSFITNSSVSITRNQIPSYLDTNLHNMD